MDVDHRRHLEELLQSHYRRLRELEKHTAMMGIETPVHVRLEIEDVRSVINRIESELTQPTLKDDNQNYLTVASPKTPALVLFLIDVGRHMNKKIEEIQAAEIVSKTLEETIMEMIFRSMKGLGIRNLYNIGCYAYGQSIYDLFSGIKPINKIAEMANMPILRPLEENGDTYEGFMHVERILKEQIGNYYECPAPLVCHISAGEYPCRNSEPIANRIKKMKVADGNILIENVLIDKESVLLPAIKPTLWSGIRDESELAKSYARQLFRMSSVIPESYREVAIERGYNLAPGSRLLYPGMQSEIIKLGLVMTNTTPIARNHKHDDD